MARIRTIKPEFCTSEQIMELSRDARLTFVLLWPFCDDGGVHPASLRKIKAELYPSDEDVTLALLGKWLDEMIVNGLIRRFTVDGQPYLSVTGWKQHQRIDKPQPLRYPQPDSPGAIPDNSLFSGGTLLEHSGSIPVVVQPPRANVPEPLPPEGKEGRREVGEEGEEGRISGRSVGAADATHGPADRFDEFWEAYPSRGSAANPKKPAREKFRRAVKAGANPEEIIRGATIYAKRMRAAGKDRTESVAQALTFLSQERWRDLLDGDEQTGTDAASGNVIADIRRQYAEMGLL